MSDAIELAAAALAPTIESCVMEWRKKWKRAPTAHELVHAFEVVLASSADDYVADAAVAVATQLPKHPAQSLRGLTSRVQLTQRDPLWDGLDRIEIILGPSAAELGRVRCLVEEKALVLAIDYWVSINHHTPPSAEDVRNLITRRAIPAWLAAHPDRKPTRVVFRAFDAFCDPVERELGGSAE